jgi:hypothetical protein
MTLIFTHQTDLSHVSSNPNSNTEPEVVRVAMFSGKNRSMFGNREAGIALLDYITYDRPCAPIPTVFLRGSEHKPNYSEPA